MIWSNDTLPCVHGPLQGLADLLEIHYTLLHLLHLLLVDIVLRVVHVVVDIAACRGRLYWWLAEAAIHVVIDIVDIVSVDDDVVDIDIVHIVRAHHFHPF